MLALEIIGWAFIGGCALAAFVAPIAALFTLFKDGS